VQGFVLGAAMFVQCICGFIVTHGRSPDDGPDPEGIRQAMQLREAGTGRAGGYSMHLEPLQFRFAPSEIVMTEGGTSG
jgi:hypothetical protein